MLPLQLAEFFLCFLCLFLCFITYSDAAIYIKFKNEKVKKNLQKKLRQYNEFQN